MKKFKIRFEYGTHAPCTQGAVKANDRADALRMVTADPRFPITQTVCDEVPINHACLFSDDWSARTSAAVMAASNPMATAKFRLVNMANNMGNCDESADLAEIVTLLDTAENNTAAEIATLREALAELEPIAHRLGGEHPRFDLLNAATAKARAALKGGAK